MTTVKNVNKKNRLTQAERTAISDQKMFEAAIQLINKSGPRNTTLKDIGELAGYSRGLANYRFGSKENLFVELIKMCTRTWIEDLDKFVGQKTGLNALLSALDAYEFFLSETADQSMALYTLWFEAASVQSELRERMSKTIATYRKDIRAWLEQAKKDNEIKPETDVELFAIQWCSFLFGTIFQWLVSPATMDVKLLVANYRANVLTTLARS